MYKNDYTIYNEIKDLHSKFSKNMNLLVKRSAKVPKSNKNKQKELRRELTKAYAQWHEETSYLAEHPGFECSIRKRTGLWIHTIKLEQKYALITQEELNDKISDKIKGNYSLSTN